MSLSTTTSGARSRASKCSSSSQRLSCAKLIHRNCPVCMYLFYVCISNQICYFLHVDIFTTEACEYETGKSFLAGRCDHQEWYFYSQRFPRYGKTGTRINRSTPSGYWKSTGKDRSVHGEHATIGYKKTLVYLHGRAHHGQRTDWAMHEYRLDDTQDAYALYRLYKKKGTNPSPDVPSGGLDKRKRTTSSPDELGTAAADEEDASRKVVPAVTAVGAEGAPMQFAASGGAVGAEGATMHFAASAGAGAPMHFAANGGAVGAEGAPMHFAPSGGAGGA
ncbi:NAC domain-containing protein 16-like isoform X1 [Triticum aestivum]|uniref:NAC domain-containing protein 16-like isoform X1 n=1 Tax=Triticum aestivum TaxID=4565 RepID=UPI001D00C6F4|nr:NAC domain-containing protein 16-like isoform X1 [Triticum aestivum]